MARYDVTLDTIDLVTIEEGFTETLGGDYELVGAAVMPGAPRPLGFYDIVIPIHGGWEESDPYPIGDTQRSQLRSLIQNDAARYAGLQFQTEFDSQINGWVVIGQASLSYAPGGPSMGEYSLQMGGVAHIASQQVFNIAHTLQVTDKREAGVPLDPLGHYQSTSRRRQKVVARHYLPVGAYDLWADRDPVMVEGPSYSTIFGEGTVVEGRGHGELVHFEQDWSDVKKAVVRAFSRRGNLDPSYSADGDRDPKLYRWAQAYGPNFPFARDDVPVLDNGRCRVRYTRGSTFEVDVCEGADYTLAKRRLTLGYSELVRARLVSLIDEVGVVEVAVRGTAGRAVAQIELRRGWDGPSVHVYHQGVRASVDGDASYQVNEGTWSYLHLGSSRDEAIIDTRGTRLLGGVR